MALFGKSRSRHSNKRRKPFMGLFKLVVVVGILAAGGWYGRQWWHRPATGNPTAQPQPDRQQTHAAASAMTQVPDQPIKVQSKTPTVPTANHHLTVKPIQIAAKLPPAPRDVPTAEKTMELINTGFQQLHDKQYLAGRVYLNNALNGPISNDDADKVRAQLQELNKALVFSPLIAQGDTLCHRRPIKPGDRLGKIAYDNKVTWQLLCRLNKISDPSQLRAGRTIKVITGPFHAVVSKSRFRMDIYLKTQDGPVYIRSFPVGLGKHDSTPIGTFIVRPNSKLENPTWVNPRTREKYEADDPNNPIGEHWLGLQGIDAATENLDGYGIHGTNEPESVGKMKSMGCIRMRADDVALVYDLLIEKHSTVEIAP